MNWDYISHTYSWALARIDTQKATWMLADQEAFYHRKHKESANV